MNEESACAQGGKNLYRKKIVSPFEESGEI
jgi:hypothetical protein